MKRGVTSRIPSTVTDFAPTFLKIASVPAEDQLMFLDRQSMLDAWKDPSSEIIAKGKEAINVELWGSAYSEIPHWEGGDYGVYFPGVYIKDDYKTMRVVGEGSGWVCSRWCTNDTEMYNSIVNFSALWEWPQVVNTVYRKILTSSTILPIQLTYTYKE